MVRKWVRIYWSVKGLRNFMGRILFVWGEITGLIALLFLTQVDSFCKKYLRSLNMSEQLLSACGLGVGRDWNEMDGCSLKPEAQFFWDFHKMSDVEAACHWVRTASSLGGILFAHDVPAISVKPRKWGPPFPEYVSLRKVRVLTTVFSEINTNTFQPVSGPVTFNVSLREREWATGLQSHLS